MEIFYKVSRKNGERWEVLDSGDEKSMQSTLQYYQTLFPTRTYRLEKYMMEVVG